MNNGRGKQNFHYFNELLQTPAAAINPTDDNDNRERLAKMTWLFGARNTSAANWLCNKR